MTRAGGGNGFPERTRDPRGYPGAGALGSLRLQASAVVTLTESGEMSIFDRSFPYVPEAVVIMGDEQRFERIKG